MTKQKDTPPADVPAAKKAAPVATLKGVRSKTIALEFPVEFDGVTYSEITVNRMTGKELAAWLSDDAAFYPPMFDCPHEVIDALDADDADTIKGAMNDFLPRKLQAAKE